MIAFPKPDRFQRDYTTLRGGDNEPLRVVTRAAGKPAG
jgi:hypothetical protein